MEVLYFVSVICWQPVIVSVCMSLSDVLLQAAGWCYSVIIIFILCQSQVDNLYSPGHWSNILEGQYITIYSHAKQTNDNLWRNIRSAGIPYWHFCNSHEHIYFFLGWFQRLLIHPEMGTLSVGHGPLLVHSSKLLPLIMALEILYSWDRDYRLVRPGV